MAERIQGPGATAGNMWTAGDPQLGIEPTEFTADWGNATQEEQVQAVIAAGLTPTNGLYTQLTQAIRILSATQFPNLVLNQGLEFWQRGGIASGIALVDGAPVYTADRILGQADDTAGAGRATVSRFVNTAGLGGWSDVVPRYYYKHDQTVAATVGAFKIQFKIDDVYRFSSRPVTFSAWLQTDGTNKDLQIRVAQNFGSGGSAEVEIDTVTKTITGSFARYDFTVAAPSISGKTIGTDHHLLVELIDQSASAYALQMTKPMVTTSTTPLPFVSRPSGTEILACRAYYHTSYEHGITPGTASAFTAELQSQSAAGVNPFPWWSPLVPLMRKTPAVTWYSPFTGAIDNVRWGGADVAVTGTLNEANNTAGLPTVAVQVADTVLAHFTADAEIP